MTLSVIRNFIFEEVIERQLVGPCLKYNFGGAYPCPNVTPQENDPGRLKSQLELYEAVLRMGVPVGVDHIRTVVGVPPPENGETLAELFKSKMGDNKKSTDNGGDPGEDNPRHNADGGDMENQNLRRAEVRKQEFSLTLDQKSLDERARLEVARYNGGTSHVKPAVIVERN